MSNIAGKSYAMNTISPLPWHKALVLKLLFFIARFRTTSFNGLLTLSLIHYARWAILRPGDFPHLDPSQPKEDLKYHYEFFFSNFNGSWDQYVDSFSSAIPGGLDLFWRGNVKYPKSVPFRPFHNYITFNQYWTSHYYNAYPMAASNDVKSAEHLRKELVDFTRKVEGASPEAFKEQYDQLLLSLQYDLSTMAPTPVVSLAAAAIDGRERPDAAC